jgi:hypothetical protein
MKKLTHIATTLVSNTLSKCAMSLVKGGTDPNGNGNPEEPEPIANLSDYEKRRERPGGGISTN